MGAAAAATPWIVGANLGLNAFQTVNGIMQSNAAASAQADATRQQAESQRQLIQRQYEMEERRRQNLLERATARARASFGARGLSPTDGSAGALLDGIESRAGEEAADARAIFDYRLGGLDSGLAASLRRIDAGRPDYLSSAQRIGGQVNQLLSWGRKMGGGGAGPRSYPPSIDIGAWNDA